ncbi:MAG: hypothetical protein HY401_01480 [Elusimicrobia bacterium]|nr:hypothetical protein [Elusimicrobiota bacterium]
MNTGRLIVLVAVVLSLTPAAGRTDTKNLIYAGVAGIGGGLAARSASHQFFGQVSRFSLSPSYVSLLGSRRHRPGSWVVETPVAKLEGIFSKAIKNGYTQARVRVDEDIRSFGRNTPHDYSETFSLSAKPSDAAWRVRSFVNQRRSAAPFPLGDYKRGVMTVKVVKRLTRPQVFGYGFLLASGVALTAAAAVSVVNYYARNQEKIKSQGARQR